MLNVSHPILIGCDKPCDIRIIETLICVQCSQFNDIINFYQKIFTKFGHVFKGFHGFDPINLVLINSRSLASAIDHDLHSHGNNVRIFIVTLPMVLILLDQTITFKQTKKLGEIFGKNCGDHTNFWKKCSGAKHVLGQYIFGGQTFL